MLQDVRGFRRGLSYTVHSTSLKSRHPCFSQSHVGDCSGSKDERSRAMITIGRDEVPGLACEACLPKENSKSRLQSIGI